MLPGIDGYQVCREIRTKSNVPIIMLSAKGEIFDKAVSYTHLIYSVTLWLAVMLLPQFFVSIFTPETAMIEFASKALRIYMAVMFLFGIQIACQMTFTALGNAKKMCIRDRS